MYKSKGRIETLDTLYSEITKYDEDECDYYALRWGFYLHIFDKKMFETVAKIGLPYILMHINSNYETMHENLIDDDIIINLNKYISEKTEELKSFGVKDIILDPGFGFGKTVEQNHQMIDEAEFIGFGKFPLLAGITKFLTVRSLANFR